jgi:hypothetical protein
MPQFSGPGRGAEIVHDLRINTMFLEKLQGLTGLGTARVMIYLDVQTGVLPKDGHCREFIDSYGAGW